MGGALLGVLALFSGFFSEMVVMATVAPIYAYWMVSLKNEFLPSYLSYVYAPCINYPSVGPRPFSAFHCCMLKSGNEIM